MTAHTKPFIRERVVGKIEATDLRDTWAPGTVSQSVEPEPIYTLEDLAAADQDVDRARADYRQAGLNVQAARTEHARCVGIWNQSLPRMSALDQARQFQASALADRQRRAEAGLYRRPSTITETARYYGTAKGAGGGRSYVRGGSDYVGKPVNKTQAMELTALRIRAQRAAEMLPSPKK